MNLSDLAAPETLSGWIVTLIVCPIVVGSWVANGLERRKMNTKMDLQTASLAALLQAIYPPGQQSIPEAVAEIRGRLAGAPGFTPAPRIYPPPGGF